jgi:hypothetical protein
MRDDVMMIVMIVWLKVIVLHVYIIMNVMIAISIIETTITAVMTLTITTISARPIKHITTETTAPATRVQPTCSTTSKATTVAFSDSSPTQSTFTVHETFPAKTVALALCSAEVALDGACKRLNNDKHARLPNVAGVLKTKTVHCLQQSTWRVSVEWKSARERGGGGQQRERRQRWGRR